MPNIDDVYREMQSLSREQAKQTERIDGALKRIDEQKALTESVHELAMSAKLLASAQKSTEKNVEGLRKDVDEIREKPAKRWDGAVTTIITSIVTAVITYFITKNGLGK